ncbi:hypothetical protein ACFSQ7_04165 [Paenibacillus rhizoplanae]
MPKIKTELVQASEITQSTINQLKGIDSSAVSAYAGAAKGKKI